MNNFFFVRHINDYNYNYNLRSVKSGAKLILVEEIIEVDEDYFVLFCHTLSLVRRIFTRLNISKRLLYRIVVTKFERRYSDELSGGTFTFFFDHSDDCFTKFMVQYFRAKYGGRMIALPHANTVLQNKMVDKGVTKPMGKQDLGFFDRVVCSSVNQSKLFKGSVLVLEDYQKFSLKKYQPNAHRDIHILILHSKFVGNVNENEFIRMLDMINEAEFHGRVVIKLHPRSSRQELQLFKKNLASIEVNKGVTDELMLSSCYVFIIQTSVILDALELGCKVVLLNYMTSNILDPELLEFCIVLESPDDLYDFLYQESLGLIFKPRRLYESVKNVRYDSLLEEIDKC